MAFSQNVKNEQTCETAGETQTPGRLKGVLGLMVSFGLIFLFMFCVGPALEKTPWLKPMADFIDERDIEANMYFYTEVEEFSNARMNWQHSLTYAPRYIVVEQPFYQSSQETDFGSTSKTR